MPMYETRFSQIKLTLSPFAADEMATIGQVLLDHMVARIKSAQDITDSPARTLKSTYAAEKTAGRRVALSGATRYRGKDIRDWTLRGRTLSACKVKSASQERVVIGPTSEETGKIMGGRNRLDKMWGVSPSDGDALTAAVLATFRRVAPVRMEKIGTRAKAA
jgi:hypothetical protein